LVNKALAALRRSRDDLWITNATNCQPFPNALDEDKNLARKCCEPRLQAELLQWSDRPILALGAVAARAFLGTRFSINEMAGSYHWVDKKKWGTRAVIPTIHPAAILRGGSGLGGVHAPDLAFWNLIYDAGKIDAIASGKDILFRENDIATEYQDAVRAEQLVAKMIADIRACGSVAIDTETYVDDERKHSALQPLNAKMSAIGLATEGWGLSVAWNVMSSRAKQLMTDVFSDPNIVKILHNRLYDLPVLERHGMPVVGRAEDTMLMHHNAFPGLSHNLQRVATQYFAITPWKSEFRKGHDTPENLTIYNARDTLVTARLFSPLTIALKRTASERTYEIDLASTVCAQWMHKVGVPISRPVNQELYETFLENMTEARNTIEDAAAAPEIRTKLWDRLAFEQAKRYRKGSHREGDSPSHDKRTQSRLDEIREADKKGYWRFSPGSSAHARALCETFGVKLQTTIGKTGRPNISTKALEALRNIPAINALYEYRTNKSLELRELACKEIETITAEPTLRDRLWKNIAHEQAFTVRKSSGTPSDPDDIEDRQKVRLTEIKELHEKGKWEWRIGSSEHVVAYLKARGVPMYFLTPTGKVSTKKEILEQFAHLSEVRALLDYRENQKMFSTFCYRLFDRYDQNGAIVKYGYADENDRIHPRWSVHKITGRWGAENPSVMNWPKADKKKGRPNLRTQVVAPPGRRLVGFDFCLAKGTEVDTPNGAMPIEQVHEGDLVFSYDFASRRVRCSRVTRHAYTGQRKTIKVILDNGSEVRCTREHRWYVRPWGIGSGAVEVQAGDLQPGMRLLPLRRSYAGPSNASYETLYSYSAFEYTKTHVTVAEAVLGPRPEGYVVHHKNGDGQDNRPENLTYKRGEQHASDHGKENAVKQWEDPSIRKKMCLGISSSIEERGGHHGINNPNYGKRSGMFGHCPNCDANTYYGGKTPRRFCDRTCYNEFRSKNRGLPRGTVWHDLNHKVQAIVEDDLVVPTYDIEVENDHNFALSAGVFVHNSQLEARIIALYSGDPFLCNIFRDHKDIHSEFARVVWPDFDKLPIEQRKKLRDTIKRPEYGAFYGGQVDTLWKNVVKDFPDVKIQDIARMVDLMTAKMPGVTLWHNQLLRDVAVAPHEIRSAIYGRRRCFPLGNADVNDVFNFPVQSAASDLMSAGLLRMMDRLKNYTNAFPILQIHDAMVFECDEEDAERLQEDVRECFEQEHTRNGITVPFPVDPGIGISWAEI
jgi:DNA polymerase I-like protein with 3'-5' exonuclease and polymerase domains